MRWRGHQIHQRWTARRRCWMLLQPTVGLMGSNRRTVDPHQIRLKVPMLLPLCLSFFKSSPSRSNKNQIPMPYQTLWPVSLRKPIPSLPKVHLISKSRSSWSPSRGKLLLWCPSYFPRQLLAQTKWEVLVRPNLSGSHRFPLLLNPQGSGTEAWVAVWLQGSSPEGSAARKAQSQTSLKCTSALFPAATRCTPRAATWKRTCGGTRGRSRLPARGRAVDGGEQRQPPHTNLKHFSLTGLIEITNNIESHQCNTRMMLIFTVIRPIRLNNFLPIRVHIHTL